MVGKSSRSRRVAAVVLRSSVATDNASDRLVGVYRLHSNAIKALVRCGQGYSLSDEGLGLSPGGYPMMPSLSADYPLPKNYWSCISPAG